ncbi:AMP-binding protein [Pigmentiphaga aceris]|uniref:AMP-binding protein n=1 Tax=Pigmentiphaga aceris TaxID=1940612 RepID=A0A5C0AYX2_9BURK|nr:AMP-binding protein [Pigmentiphaga aceris]QEI07629.1 AMP-binding protein [Pigmentiphaga aceris]
MRLALADLLLPAPGTTDLAPLQTRALAMAGGFHARGIRQVAVYLDDAWELACVLLGAWRAGVCVTLPGDQLPGTIARLAPTVQCWVNENGAVAEPATDDPVSATPSTVTPAVAASTLLTLAPDALIDQPLPAQSLALGLPGLILATSGSTGESKLIGKTLTQLANEVDVLETLWGDALRHATILGSVSTQHIYGLLFRVLWPLIAGRSIDRKQLPFPEDLQRATLAHDQVAWISSPALLKRMGDNLDWAALGSRVAKVFSSGGPLAAETSQSLHARLGQAPIEVYGSSETGGVGWRQGGDRWTPFPGTDIGQDADGSLWVRSSYLPLGHTEHMADAVQIDADGFRLLGRLDRIVKLEEKRISLPRIEQVLCIHDWVSDARLGVVSGRRASLGALVALSSAGIDALRAGGRRAMTEVLRQALAPHVEELALPRRWRFVRHLPTNSQGKLRQVDVDAQLQADRPHSPIVQHLDRQGDTLHIQLEVPLDLAHFSGHFTQAPVLPGVLQIGWAIELARQHLDFPPCFAGMEVIKFQRLLRPGDTTLLELRFDAARGKLYFSYRADDAPNSSGRVLFKDHHA